MIDAKNKPFVEADGKHPKGTKDNRKYYSEIKSSWDACCARYEPPYLKVDIDDYDHNTGAIKDPIKDQL